MLNRIRKAWNALAGKQRLTMSAEDVALKLAEIRATYDAARTTNEFKNYWANADRYDADSAHSPDVRHTLMSRSRFAVGNNGFSDGITRTYATDLVGLGPQLRMQTSSTGFNQMVELSWFYWTKAIHFRRKLWCLAHAKVQDGEGIGVLRSNPRVKHPIPLDVVLVEAEQCQTPYLPFGEVGYIDGIKFDEFGNPQWYDVLRDHPGSNDGIAFSRDPERIPADRVLHWFKLRRPGQHRGVPEMSSTLNTGAAAHRWREATVAAAEQCADWTLLMKTQQMPDDADPVAPFSTMDITKRMMGFLPAGWDPWQADAKFPTATHESFSKSLVNEQARPLSMPYNKAACDSSSYNYASGRLDHQTYHSELNVDREDCNDLVLDPLFSVWFDFAVLKFGWLGGNPQAITEAAKAHIWDWPKHGVADVQSEAEANATKLTSGQLSLHRLYTDAGLDIEDEIPAMAQTFGVDEAEIRKRLLDITLPMQQTGGNGGSLPSDAATEEAVAAALRHLERRRESLTSKVTANGGNHAN